MNSRKPRGVSPWYFIFKIIAKEGKARAGVLKTAHGDVLTPTFMPVGTQGSVKALSPQDLKETGSQIILGNTYHLYLRPGSKLIKKMGGLHKFMGWDGPILTDSGGFQAFSLGAGIEHRVKKIQVTSDKRQGEYNNEIATPLHGLAMTEGNPPSPRFRRARGESAKGVVDYRVDIDRYDSKIVDNREKFPQDREKKGNGVVAGIKSLESSNRILNDKNIYTKMIEEGVLFTSHLDGSRHLLTPEKSIGVQLDLGSDIVLTLDELVSPLHSPIYVEESLERTHRWEERSKKYFEKNLKSSSNPKAILFGIIQGVYDREIRENEAKWIADKGFDGISIGGSCGTSKYWPTNKIATLDARDDITFWATRAIYETMGWVTPLLPDSLPRHALGIGEIVDFFECIERGVDMFDCVSPTRRARNGSLYISPKSGGKEGNRFVISIQRAEYATDKKPIDPGCGCYSCQNFSRAYLRHLYVSGELLYHRLASIHNVYFFNKLLSQIKESIKNKQFQKLKRLWLK